MEKSYDMIPHYYLTKPIFVGNNSEFAAVTA